MCVCACGCCLEMHTMLSRQNNLCVASHLLYIFLLAHIIYYYMRATAANEFHLTTRAVGNKKGGGDNKGQKFVCMRARHSSDSYKCFRITSAARARVICARVYICGMLDVRAVGREGGRGASSKRNKTKQKERGECKKKNEKQGGARKNETVCPIF